MEGLYLCIVAVIMTAFIATCNNTERVTIDCATKGKYESMFSDATIECSVPKKESK